MEKFQVFVTRRLSEDSLFPLREIADVEVWNEDTFPSKSILLEKMPCLDGLLCLLTDPIDEEVIQAAGSRFKVISQMAVGYDNINIQAATRRGIPVGHTPGVLTETCADFAFALLLAAARRVTEGDRSVHQGNWPTWGPYVFTGQEIHGSTLGIVGFGRIGQAVAKRARGFDMRILVHDPKTNPESEKEVGATHVDFDTLLHESDFISLHTYLSKETHHLINRSIFEKMKPSVILINTSRGPIVDSDALIWALQSKKIAGAGLDVFDPEPIPSDSPLLKMENVVITPHIASASIQTRQQMAEIAINNLIAGLKNEELLYCVNPQVQQR
jgi:glyoxylate reductase